MNMSKQLFSSLSAMEDRIAVLMRDAMKSRKVSPAHEPRLLYVARKAIDRYGADDNAVINSIVMAAEVLEPVERVGVVTFKGEYNGCEL